MENTKFKDKMTRLEMEAAFKVENPYLVPNNINVGKFAKDHGYRKVQQMVDGVILRFYLKNKD